MEVEDIFIYIYSAITETISPKAWAKYSSSNVISLTK